jgi:hypothetical protein
MILLENGLQKEINMKLILCIYGQLLGHKINFNKEWNILFWICPGDGGEVQAKFHMCS